MSFYGGYDGAARLSKELYDQAKKLGVSKIIVNWEGGSDNGYCNIDLEGATFFSDNSGATETLRPSQSQMDRFRDAVDNWASREFNYSGAGEGIPYGDTYTYDLDSGLVTHSSWHMQRVEGDEGGEAPLEFTAEEADANS